MDKRSSDAYQAREVTQSRLYGYHLLRPATSIHGRDKSEFVGLVDEEKICGNRKKFGGRGLYDECARACAVRFFAIDKWQIIKVARAISVMEQKVPPNLLNKEVLKIRPLGWHDYI